jgi:hypothetical protein
VGTNLSRLGKLMVRVGVKQASEHGAVLPLLVFLGLFLRPIDEYAPIFLIVLVAAQFLCIFLGKYFYYLAEEMQI